MYVLHIFSGLVINSSPLGPIQLSPSNKELHGLSLNVGSEWRR